MFHLEVVSDEAVFESRCRRVLDGEVPATENLIAHIHTVTFPQHPCVLVANCRSIGKVYTWMDIFFKMYREMAIETFFFFFAVLSGTTNLRTTMMRLRKMMVRIPARYSRGVFKQSKSREPRV